MKRILVGAAVAGVMASGSAYAATQSVTANINFDTPLVLSKTQDINFGTVAAGTAGVYTIPAASSPTVTATSGGVWLYGTPQAASINVTGSTADGITISTGGYTAQGNVTPSAAVCKYGSGTATSCDAGISVTGTATPTVLLVGATVTATGSTTAGTPATPSFTVTAVYQ